jgi:DNA-binding NtrC family response regulator
MQNRPSALVVDSDPHERVNTITLLESMGYGVMSAGNFDEAKQLLAIHAVDLLVTDLRLGSYNGLHLIVRTKTDHPQMAALVTSRFADPVLQAEAARQGAGFLLRPAADADFLAAITSTLSASGSGPLSGEIC